MSLEEDTTFSEDNFQKEETDKRQKQLKFQEGVRALIGGILIQMFNGSFFLWPTLSIYVISYLKQFNGEIDENAHFRGNLILVLTNCAGYQIGPYLANQRKWNPKCIVALGSSIAIIGVTISSYMTNFWLFMFFYGAFSGIGCGSGYIVPLICLWDHFPTKKGMMTGVIAGSYGIGSLIYTQVATRYVNPLGLTPSLDIGIPDYKLFGVEVANNVPIMLRSLACLYTIQCIIGICLINRPKEDQSKNQCDSTTEIESLTDLSQSTLRKYDQQTKQILREYDLVSLSACLHSRRFWEYFSFFVFSDLLCVLFVGQYKSLALAHGYSDRSMSIAASLSSISQTLGRFISSSLYDVYGVKPVFLTMMIVMFILGITVYDMLQYPMIYLGLVQVNFYCLGGIFSIFPAPISKSFGPKFGAQVYTLALLGGLVSSLIITIMMQFLAKPLGIQGLFNIGASFALITIIQIVSFDERIDIERLDEKGLIVWGGAVQRTKNINSDDDFERAELEMLPIDDVERQYELVSDLPQYDANQKMLVNKILLQNKFLSSYKQKETDYDDNKSDSTMLTRHTDGSGSGERLIERGNSMRNFFGKGSGERLLEKKKKSRSKFIGTQCRNSPETSDWSSDAESDHEEKDTESQTKKINDYFSLIKE